MKNQLNYLLLVLILLVFQIKSLAQMVGDSVVVNCQSVDFTESLDSDEGAFNLVRGTVIKIEEIKEYKFSKYFKTTYDSQIGYVYAGCCEKITSQNRSEIKLRKKRIENLKRNGLELLIQHFNSDINSVGGVSVNINIFNNSRTRTIKYITFTIVPFNSVGDKTKGMISGKSTIKIRGVGPIKPRKPAYFQFDNILYNSTATCLEIRKVVVEYMDKHKFVYIKDLKKILDLDKNVDLKLIGDCAK